jgi:hypothetical protein
MKKTALLLSTLCCASIASAQDLVSYQAAVSAQSPNMYYKLDGTLEDAVTSGNTLTVNGLYGTFIYDALRNADKAYAVYTNTDALIISADPINGGGAGADAAASGKGSVSFLFRTLTQLAAYDRWVFSQQENTPVEPNSLGMHFESNTGADPSALMLHAGDASVAILSSNSIALGSWYFFTVTWDESRDAGEVKWYLGQLGKTLASGTIDIANDAVIGDNASFIIGNGRRLEDALKESGNDHGTLDEIAFWNRELSSEQVAGLFSTLPNFKYPVGASYQQVIAAQKPLHWFNFENTLTDVMDPNLTLSVQGTGNGFGGNAVSEWGEDGQWGYWFSGQSNALFTATDLYHGGGEIIAEKNGLSGNKMGSMSFLFKSLSALNGPRYVISQGTSSTPKNQLAVYFEGASASAPQHAYALRIKIGNATPTIVPGTNLTELTWYYFAMTSDESRNKGEVRWYLGPVGGTLWSGVADIDDEAVIGNDETFYIGSQNGFNNSFRNPGTGRVDEFATWEGELTEEEIKMQFASVFGVPAIIEPPQLSIVASGADLRISWPATTPDEFVIEASASLTDPAWEPIGSPNVEGDSKVVTVTPSGDQWFYRLHKP